jgi:hypothetical protein
MPTKIPFCSIRPNQVSAGAAIVNKIAVIPAPGLPVGMPPAGIITKRNVNILHPLPPVTKRKLPAGLPEA